MPNTCPSDSTSGEHYTIAQRVALYRGRPEGRLGVSEAAAEGPRQSTSTTDSATPPKAASPKPASAALTKALPAASCEGMQALFCAVDIETSSRAKELKDLKDEVLRLKTDCDSKKAAIAASNKKHQDEVLRLKTDCTTMAAVVASEQARAAKAEKTAQSVRAKLTFHRCAQTLAELSLKAKILLLEQAASQTGPCLRDAAGPATEAWCEADATSVDGDEGASDEALRPSGAVKDGTIKPHVAAVGDSDEHEVIDLSNDDDDDDESDVAAGDELEVIHSADDDDDESDVAAGDEHEVIHSADDGDDSATTELCTNDDPSKDVTAVAASLQMFVDATVKSGLESYEAWMQPGAPGVIGHDELSHTAATAEAGSGSGAPAVTSGGSAEASSDAADSGCIGGAGAASSHRSPKRAHGGDVEPAAKRVAKDVTACFE